MLAQIVVVIFSAVLINNYVLYFILGICPFVGVSRQVETAVGMGLAVTFVMALASGITYGVQQILITLKVEYLQTLTFILVIAALVQFVESVLKKMSPGLYKALGVYLPLITTNCAVLGVALINMTRSFDLLTSVVNGTAAALGFLLAITIFAAIRERWPLYPIPRPLEGFPIALITAGLMSLAFTGFQNFNVAAMLGR